MNIFSVFFSFKIKIIISWKPARVSFTQSLEILKICHLLTEFFENDKKTGHKDRFKINHELFPKTYSKIMVRPENPRSAAKEESGEDAPRRCDE